MPLMWIYIDYRRLYYVLFSLITLFMPDINSKTSTHWFLNEIKEQVVPGLIRRDSNSAEHYQHSENERDGNCLNNCNTSFDVWDPSADSIGYAIMSILSDSSRIYHDNDKWELHFSSSSSYHVKSVQDPVEKEDPIFSPDPPKKPSIVKPVTNISKNQKTIANPTKPKNKYNVFGEADHEYKENDTSQPIERPNLIITCSPYVNQTQYDHLNGIHNRDSFKFFPEPEVALMFGKRSGDNSKIEINLNTVVAQLLEARIKKPRSSNVFNNIGNLLRIHGESREAVECFRYALRLSPHHPDVLLNLARVLYNQNFLEDAIYLTRHSLETQPRNRNPWLQHFTLGEFLRSTGHKQEAQYHFIQSLEFNPGFGPAKDYLKEFSVKSNAINIVYSFCISVFLLSLVLYIAFLNLEFYNADSETQKSHRHFNRAMVLKGLKMANAKSKNRRSI